MDRNLDIICIGVAIVDSIIKGFDPEPISITGYRAESGSLNAGGDAVNEAMACAGLGLKTGILCFLGEDLAGGLMEQQLARQGVDTSLIIRTGDHPTPVTTIFLQEDGNRKSIVNTAHRYNFHPEQHADLLAGTRAVILGSLFRAPFDDPEIIAEVLQSAKSHGVKVVADTKIPNYRKMTLTDIRECLPLVDCITPNEDEARYYTGKTDPAEMAEVFSSCGVGQVIIKLGPKGCYYRSDSDAFYMPAFKVDAVDATGAGDCFMAGLVSETLRGSTPAEALRFASACGAVCTTMVGATAALKSREQILRFLREQR